MQDVKFIKRCSSKLPFLLFLLFKQIFFFLFLSLVRFLKGVIVVMLLQLDLSNTLPSFFLFSNLWHDNPQHTILKLSANFFLVDLDIILEFDFALKHADFSSFVLDEAVHHGF